MVQLTSYPVCCLLQIIKEDNDKVPNTESLLRYPRNEFRLKNHAKERERDCTLHLEN